MAANNVSLSQSQLQIASELEIEMMQDLYTRMTNVCHQKCVPPKYRDNELSKGEGVCIDRCVAKYFEMHDRIGKKLTALTQAQAQQQTDPSKTVGTY